MRRVFVAGLLVVALAPALEAKGKPLLTMALVRAQCASPPPAPPAPCAPAFDFATGTVTLTDQKQPTPSCPRTGNPSESPAGSIKLRGVTRDGAPFTGTLFLSIEQVTSFGADTVNGNCQLSGVPPFAIESLTAYVACRTGKCKATILPIGCLPKTCADTPIVSEFGALTVYDVDDPATRIPVARPGIVVTPARSDPP
jgi:hypothetical protein